MKAFYIECSAPFWLTTAQTLLNEHGLEPVYWTGLSDFAPELKQAFPNLIHHDCRDAQRGVPFLSQQDLPKATFDAVALDIWQQEAHTFYEMLSRFDFSGDYTYEDRRRYFFHNLLHWYAIFQKFKPDVIIFPNAPIWDTTIFYGPLLNA